MKKVPCEVYSRVVGYFRPVQNWNLGKKAEFDDRVSFDEKVSLAHNFANKFEVKMEKSPEAAKEVIVEAPSDTLKYKIFTLPTCHKCHDTKAYLSTTPLEGKDYDLSTNEGRGALRQHFNEIKDRIKRSEDGSLPIPLVLFFDSKNRIAAIATDLESTKKLTNLVAA